MATDTATDRLVTFAPARPEPDISLSGFHTVRHIVTVESPGNNKSFSMAKPLKELFADYLLGCGRVEVKSIVVIYNSSAAGQTISAGLANALGSFTHAQVGMSSGNFLVTSNAMNAGDHYRKELDIPGNLSRQIQPVSSMLPDFKFYLSVDPGMACSFEVELNVFGPVVHRHLSSALKV